MRQIEKRMLEAVRNGRPFRETNTKVAHANGNAYVWLYDTIIYANVDGREYYSDGGYKTQTTGSRLRALGARYSITPKNCEVELAPQDVMRSMWRKDISGEPKA